MPFSVWRSEGFEGIELSSYRDANRTFPTSLVTQYNFGVRLEGVREMTYRNRRFTTGPGILHGFAPGVALSAKPLSAGAWHYLDVRFTEAGLTKLLGADTPDFGTLGLTGAVDPAHNDFLRERFLVSHAAARNGAPKLEQEEKLLAWLRPLFGRTEGEPVGREHRAVGLVRDYLYAHLNLNVDLEELSDLTDLSRQYLMRVFRRETGLTPYQYQAGLRLARAQRLLADGMIPAQVALEVGLYDQSALNRLFRRYTFLTPGQYQRAVWLERS